MIAPNAGMRYGSSMSQRTRVKICCIASIDEARLAIDSGADAVGLVTDMPSGPGIISDEQARGIAGAVPPPIAQFLLSSHSEARSLIEQSVRCGCSTLQVVRHVEPSVHLAIASALPAVRRVQVIHVQDTTALDLIEPYARHVHAFLLDSGRPATPGASGEELGGTGRTHDWSISAEFVRRSPKPVFLAGGLTPNNVALAIETVRPYGLDLCSGVRTHGQLDPAKLNAFMTAVRAA